MCNGNYQYCLQSVIECNVQNVHEYTGGSSWSLLCIYDIYQKYSLNDFLYTFCMNGKDRLLACFCDIRTAFDSLPRNLLFHTLLKDYKTGGNFFNIQCSRSSHAVSAGANALLLWCSIIFPTCSCVFSWLNQLQNNILFFHF